MSTHLYLKKMREKFNNISKKNKTIIIVLIINLLIIITAHDYFLVSADYVNGDLFKPLSEKKKEKKIEFIKENPDYEMDDMETYEVGRNTRKTYQIKKDLEIINTFTSKTKYLTLVRIRFYNPNPESIKGSVNVYIKDESGEILGETNLPISKIGNKRMTDFSFTGNTEYINSNRIIDFNVINEETKGIKAKGQDLSVVMEVKGFEGENFAVYLSNDRKDDNQPQMYFVQRGNNVAASAA